MCGICGYIGKNRITDDELVLMRDTMIYRGPDDAGIYHTSVGDRYIGMAHRRLSIFDLSELGHQPMTSEDGRYTIVFNGEIYNFIELRQELINEGFHFRSQCDTEVILYAYIHWKQECFNRFNGMFALAILDSFDGCVVMARDRMGVKPLYYYHNDTNGDFVFASELKPIMKYPGFHKNMRKEVIGSYLCNKYIASDDTIFQNTYKVAPGTYLEYRNGNIQISKYWDILKEKQLGESDMIKDYRAARHELYRLLTDSVNLRMAADVPVGLFLSGGIDSTIVAAIAQKHSLGKIKTFTIGFNEKERNEADRAKAIAEYLGTDHTEMYVGENEIREMIDDIPRYYDEPFADSSQLPTMLVCKLAAHDVTVALSGDGGDELFCGYKMYDWTYFAQRTDIIGKILYGIPGMNGLKDRLSPELRAFINNRDENYKTQFFIDVMTEQARAITGDITVDPRSAKEKALKYDNWQERRMILDMLTYLPDEVMAKTDRASMKYSLEVRNPILDHRIVEASFRIPHEFKYHHYDKKHILKELAYEHIPKEMLKGPKRGFGIPLAKWLRGPLKEEIDRCTDTMFIKKQGLFDSEAVEELKSKQNSSNKIIYSSMLWSLYIFQRWWENYIG